MRQFELLPRGIIKWLHLEATHQLDVSFGAGRQPNPAIGEYHDESAVRRFVQRPEGLAGRDIPQGKSVDQTTAVNREVASALGAQKRAAGCDVDNGLALAMDEAATGRLPSNQSGKISKVEPFVADICIGRQDALDNAEIPHHPVTEDHAANGAECRCEWRNQAIRGRRYVAPFT
ncbi:hypothetical protein JQ593_30580 [Bradyrhizobium viridifuturi]|uniref:hypothetical protein n=1 Tax=uncultured Bradyrhizobium sp. TaxID=199684 RepID=UPI001BAD6E22|nr:hypothetical protein [uncultured Bradyrhizobium sp.]MBR1040898.1 hypothetical protein [Bradyrhizobium viridifuturi]MBR1077451.1 hypothetical protein [Bradyrhizobium viridifuturi]